MHACTHAYIQARQAGRQAGIHTDSNEAFSVIRSESRHQKWRGLAPAHAPRVYEAPIDIVHHEKAQPACVVPVIPREAGGLLSVYMHTHKNTHLNTGRGRRDAPKPHTQTLRHPNCGARTCVGRGADLFQGWSDTGFFPGCINSIEKCKHGDGGFK